MTPKTCRPAFREVDSRPRVAGVGAPSSISTEERDHSIPSVLSHHFAGVFAETGPGAKPAEIVPFLPHPAGPVTAGMGVEEPDFVP